MLKSREFVVKYQINIICENCKIFSLNFTIFETIFIFSFWHKNFKIIGCGKPRLLKVAHFEIAYDRSSRSKMFFKNGDLKNSAVFSRKHLCWSLFFNKVALKLFIKKATPTHISFVNIAKVSKGILKGFQHNTVSVSKLFM